MAEKSRFETTKVEYLRRWSQLCDSFDANVKCCAKHESKASRKGKRSFLNGAKYAFVQQIKQGSGRAGVSQ